jgi:diacylglycerol kinase family enzyme
VAARTKPEATLIVNPNAGRLSESARAEVIDGLRSRFRLRELTTTTRAAGITISSEVVASGARLVISFGGDGHVNEVANGLAGTEASLGIIPGGTMNVFARALGVPLEPMAAVDFLAGRLERSDRLVPLGQVDDRYFTVSAGCGFDAEAAARVERHLTSKRLFGELFFYWSAFRVLMRSYRHRSPWMDLRGPFGEVKVAMAVANNAGPYAYFANRAVNLAPRVELARGLDVFALQRMRIETLPLYAWRVAVSGDLVHHGDALYVNDVDHFELSSAQPFARHVDGEPLAPARAAHFTVVKDALRVRA